MKEILRALRIENGLTQKELAKILKSSDKNIWNYEKGLATPPYDILVAYADYFEVTTDYLIGRTDDFGAPTAAPMGESMTADERELLRLYRSISPYLQSMTLDAVRSWAKKDADSTRKKV